MKLLLLALGCLFGLTALFILNPVWGEKTQEKPKVLLDHLKDHVQFLTSITPARNFRNQGSLEKAAQYISSQFERAGLRPRIQEYRVGNILYKNVRAILGNEAHPERVVVGAHYDVCEDQPGADDNASGVAGLLELARLLGANQQSLKTPIEFVAYVLEEPPYFATEFMGSFIHARTLKEENIAVSLMLSLEMIGYFSDEPGSQRFPTGPLRWFLPERGNFIALVGQIQSWWRMRDLKRSFQSASDLTVYSFSGPSSIVGIDWSDHRSYWYFDFPAIMVTDTSLYRNPNYHQKTDVMATLDFQRMSMVIQGVYGILVDLGVNKK